MSGLNKKICQIIISHNIANFRYMPNKFTGFIS